MSSKIIIIILFSFLILEEQTMGQTFQRTYGGINNDEGISIASSYNGTSGILAQETDSAYNTWMNIIKIDSTGNIIWKKKIMSQIQQLYGIGISATPDSGFIIASNYIITGSSSNLLLLKLNAYGDTIWTKSYSCPDGAFNSVFSSGQIIVTSDGGYAVTGTSHSLSLFLLKTDSIGNAMWLKYYQGYPSQGLSIKEDSNGDYVLCGSRGPGHYSIFLIKTNSTGDILFTRILDKGYPGILASSMDFTTNKGYIIAGAGLGSGVNADSSHGFLINLDSLANIIWVKSYPSIFIRAVRTYADGYLIVASDTGYADKKLYLLKSDSTGNIIWAKSYGGVAKNEGIDILKNSDSYYIFGTTRNFSHGLEDVYLINTDTNGISSCHEDSIVITSTTSTLLQNSGCILDSGFIVTNSLITIDTSTYDVYDACICVPPVSFFHNYSFCCLIYNFTDYSTWTDVWHWDFGDGDTSNVENPSHQFSSVGTYYVCLTVSNSCGSDTYCDSVLVIYMGTSEESKSKNNLILFPNPSNGSFQIVVNSNIINGLVSVTNIIGAVVYSERFTGDRKILNCNLNSGIYFVQVTDNNKTWRKKIIIE